jgi:NDP-sugar pyrophosphorylase family protein
VGHLAGLIQAYFKDGQEWNLQITYAYETTPLGTAGPLARTPLAQQSTLVLNGDLLTTLDFGSLVRFHEKNQPAATIGAKRRIHKVDFGVIETGNGEITAFHEKPTLDYLVSIGVYVFSPEVTNFIPSGQHFDFPDLIKALMASGERVLSYETDAYWMDIGRPDDYSQANEDFPNMEQEFLRSYVASAVV